MPTVTSSGPEEEVTAQGGIAGAVAGICRAVQATRPRRVVSLLVLLWVLNIFDLAYTIQAHRTGHFLELNPIARDLLYSPWALAGFKLVAVSVGSVILLCLRRHRLAELATWFLLLAYASLTIRWLDVCTILLARQ